MSDLSLDAIGILQKGRARLIKGWCKGAFGDVMGDGPVCAYGALVAAHPMTCHLYVSAIRDALRALEDEAGVPRTTGVETVRIGAWNDAPERTHAEVVALFDRVLLKHGVREKARA